MDNQVPALKAMSKSVVEVVDLDIDVAPPGPDPAKAKRLAVLTLFVHHPPPETANYVDAIKNYGNLSELHTIGLSARENMTEEQIGIKVATLRNMFSMLDQSLAAQVTLCEKWKQKWSTQSSNFTLISITMMDLRDRPAPENPVGGGEHEYGPIQLKSCNYVWIQVVNDMVQQFRVMKDAWEEQ